MAKKLPPVHCRICKKEIHRDDETGWVMPSKNYFYHEKCYEGWVAKKNDLHTDATTDEWFEALYYYLRNVIKAPIDYKKVQSQWKNLLKQKKTAKGIYFSIRYFYDVSRGDINKCQGGIGICSSIYEESCAYWYAREEKESGICDRIEKQMKEQAAQKTIVLKQTKKNTIRNRAISLDEIAEMED